MKNWRESITRSTVTILWLMSCLGIAKAQPEAVVQGIKEVKADSPVYLAPFNEQAFTFANEALSEKQYASHYSHSSHSSHYSHRSHSSHYSGHSSKEDNSTLWLGGGAVVAYGVYRFFKK